MVRILVAEQHAVIREGLKQIVAANRDIAIAGEASSAQKVLDEISRNNYDVVILDISLPGRNWLDLLKELRSNSLLHEGEEQEVSEDEPGQAVTVSVFINGKMMLHSLYREKHRKRFRQRLPRLHLFIRIHTRELKRGQERLDC